MPVKGSINYVWFTEQLLGQGATGNVFRGRHKKKGDLCAVKIINAAGHTRLSAIQKRELDVMKRLDHKNIVKLLGIEEESQSKEKVMIMELCQGGSLYSVLEEPENSYGVPEDEFLIILNDIASGMEYLHEKGVVHRDVKPGNILRCISDDERSIYKLTDFGGAREIQSEEENFMSMFGTEEYLHPDMYERALLNGPKDRQFDATVDLWSVGVTLYHVATGQLPFRPYGGRRSKQEMHLITSKKGRGVISGVQHVQNGDISYDTKLPRTCKLSIGLQNKVTPIIAGLLENNPRYKFSFDDFFKKVEELKRERHLDIFCITTFTHLRVYLHSCAKMSHLREQLAEQTEIPVGDQVLIYKGNMIDDVVEPVTPVADYPPTLKTSPIVVFTSADNWCLSHPYTPEPPEISDPTLNGDSHMAKKYCGLMYYLHSILQDVLLGEKILQEAAGYVRALTRSWFKGTRDVISECWKTVDQTLKRSSYLQKSTIERLEDWNPSYLGVLSELYADRYQESETTLQRKLDEISRFSEHMKQTKDKVERYNISLYEKFKKMTDSMKKQLMLSDTSESGVARSQSFVKDIKRIHVQFKEDRKKTLTYNEDQIHKYEKFKIRDIYASQQGLYESILSDNLHPLHKKAKSNICLLWKYREKISAIEREGGKIDDDAARLSSALDDLEIMNSSSFSMLREERGRVDKGGKAAPAVPATMCHSSGYGSDIHVHSLTALGPRSSGIQLSSDPSLPSYPSSASRNTAPLTKRLRTDGPAIRMLELKECLTQLSDQSQTMRKEINTNSEMLAGLQDMAQSPEDPYSMEESRGYELT